MTLRVETPEIVLQQIWDEVKNIRTDVAEVREAQTAMHVEIIDRIHEVQTDGLKDSRDLTKKVSGLSVLISIVVNAIMTVVTSRFMKSP